MATQQTLNFNYIEDVPSSNWKTPKTLPDLVDSTVIALDTETYDPHLLERGPGWDIGDGYICGVSVSVSKQATWYLPIGKNGFIIEEVVDWLQDTFTKDVTMVGANLMYDLGWLQHAGFKTQCKLFDIQFVEALLNEHRDGYSLDSLAEQYGYGGKHSSDLYQWCANNFGGIVSDRQRANIYRAPVSLVGPYAEADAFLPLLIREQQLPQIVYQELQAVVDLEHGLIPMLLAMRKRGVRVDMKARDELSKYIGQRLAKAFVVSKDIAGRVVNVNAANDIAKVFDANGWEYPLLPPTPKQKARAEITGLPIPPKPSFIKAWLQAQHDNPFALAVADLRGLDKLKGTFVDGYFKLVRDGRMHGCIHPLRTGANGTVSGRMSCSKANLTNIPARDPEFGPRIRGLFLPDEGEDWVSMDYSQIELKFLAHYALGKGAKETRKLMNDDPTVDFHQMVMDKTGLPRKPAKTVSFSLCYGSGVANTATLLDCTEDEARAFREKHFAGMPFMKETFDECTHVANTRGYLFTIMGRRARFPFWEANKYRLPEGSREEAEELGLFDSREACQRAVDDLVGMDIGTTSFVQRAKTYKALNSLLQGSAADMMKKAMLDIWNSGVCDVLGAPLNVVHDELNWSVPKTALGNEAAREAQHLMNNALKLKVPVTTSFERGNDWGHLKKEE